RRKIGMIQHVEHFRPELELEGIANRECAVYRKVPLRRSEAPQEVSGHVALARITSGGINRWVGERVRIKSLSARARDSRGEIAGRLMHGSTLLSEQIKRLPWNEIGPNVGKDAAI